ncbi:MAG: DNA mismatch repair protein MutS [Vulcanimicrobiota bacterium]
MAEEPIHGEIFKEILKTAFPAEKIDSIEWKENTESGMASAVLVNYLNQTQKTHRHSLNEIEFYNLADYMILDSTTWRNLELTYTIMERQKKGSLLWVVDQTRTGMGARLLRAWMERPLLDRRKINARLDSVQEFFDNYTLHNQLTSALKPIYDLERITTKVVYGSANPRDLLSLKNSLEKLPAIKELLADTESSLNRTLFQALDTLEDIFNLIEISISPDAPVTIKEGGVIRDGYNRELDELRNIRENARDWIRDMELREKEKTGIKSLKVKFNKVFGYFIEVTRPNLHLVPEDYIRKQTIANGERFISPELKEYEAKIMGAEEKIFDIEYNLFLNIREKIAGEAGRIQKTSRVVAMLDVLTCFATVAMNQKFTRPEIIKENRIEIRDGRHPVVEKVLKGNFVPNNTFIGKKDSRFHIITGPNMSGKSTYLRQIGLICILAQMGSFVPAMKASLGIIDRVFTRVGASDDLHLGKSTFLVEMSETANIIKNATRQSLILLDEIGRGTSTYDGMSIAWSVSEYLYNKINACTLFATHFHQLTQMAEKLTGVKNYRVDVKETNKEIIFLHKIVAGGTDKSYGIYVAKLAGLPPVILNRARDILEELEARHEQTETLDSSQKGHGYQLTLFEPAKSPVQQELELIDPDQLTPMKALEKIYEWKKKA